MFGQHENEGRRTKQVNNMPHVNPDMLVLAREYMGLSQTGLAKRLSFTQSTLSRYESGLLEVPEEHLGELARVLGRPSSFFSRWESLYSSSSMHHRKQAGLSMRDTRRVHAQINDMRIQATQLLEDAEIESQSRFHRLDLVKAGSPEAVARQLRDLWGLPTGPIRNVTSTIESAGGIVFQCTFPTHKVIGISMWPIDDPRAAPVFFTSDIAPGDRQRFTLAHEIGHVVMHHLPTDGNQESEANAFAREFLMPADEIGRELSNLSLPKAAALKSYWKVSMAAIVFHAHALGKITERQYRYLNMQLAKCGYKKREPVPIPQEEPALFGAIMDVHRTHYGRSDEELADMLGMFPDEFREKFGYGSSGLKLVV